MTFFSEWSRLDEDAMKYTHSTLFNVTALTQLTIDQNV